VVSIYISQLSESQCLLTLNDANQRLHSCDWCFGLGLSNSPCQILLVQLVLTQFAPQTIHVVVHLSCRCVAFTVNTRFVVIPYRSLDAGVDYVGERSNSPALHS
jgi:hypothetical protein